MIDIGIDILALLLLAIERAVMTVHGSMVAIHQWVELLLLVIAVVLLSL